MREKLTNAGKKEQRQINHLLNKELTEERMDSTGMEVRKPITSATRLPPAENHIEGKAIEARTVAKQHGLKGKKGK